jgi:hypothetical protein
LRSVVCEMVVGMEPQAGTKPLSWAVLLLTAGLLGCCPIQGQESNGFGSLAGKLTDTHSSPLENVSITLRCAGTGIALMARTTRGGKYHFIHVPAGEYTLSAAGPLGSGQVGEILISAEHEAKVQAVLDFGEPPKESVFIPGVILEDPDWQTPAEATRSAGAILSRNQKAIAPAPPTVIAEMSFAPEALRALPLTGAEIGDPAESSVAAAGIHPDEISASESTSLPANGSSSEMETTEPTLAPDTSVEGSEAIQIVSIPETILAARLKPAAQISASGAAFAGRSTEGINAEQIQALPLVQRDWTSFLPGSSHTSDSGEDERRPATTGVPQETTMDGSHVGSEFGGYHPARRGTVLAGSTTGESAISEVRPSDPATNWESRGLLISTTSQRGTEHLHGQAFVFDRQNLLGARNPFTSWIQETSPASGSAIPVFTAQPYTPPDTEALWGSGIGGVLRRRHLFWFGALDGFHRNDPGVATVKHPENFFAQPTNDDLQLLSAQLGWSGADPVGEGAVAYSRLIESLSTLLGPAPRSATQWIGFGRLDWSATERHRFTLEASGASLDSPGGGYARASETLGNHSFGSVQATEQWMIGRWEAFVTPNLLAVTQGSAGHVAQTEMPGKPSMFEQSLNINAWGQLPQIVVDSRYGFTIGNPARFGRGNYPDEHLYEAQEQLNWVHGSLMLKSGIELRHDNDATSELRNQTGTYHYSSIASFASDALAFSTFGLNGQLNPMDQHNCDQRGQAWRDTAGVLHGLGFLPCYSYYSQTMGPSEWWLSTNDWAAFSTGQWQPTKSMAFTFAMRWELEELPAPIRALDNPDLPLTQQMPALGNQWAPRAGLAWGTGESRWPVVRFGYGMYFSRTRNSVAETALTRTGSLKGDLNFFMRPTDNLTGAGAPPFPYVLAGEPASVVKPGAVEFAPVFRNGEVQQVELSLEETIPGRFHLEAGAIGSLGRRLPVTFDVNIDPAVNPKTLTYAVIDGNGSGPIKAPQITVPFFASWPSVSSSLGSAGRLNSSYQQVSEIFSRANSTYEALLLRISRNARAFALRARYTYAHAMDWNPDETSQLSGPSVLDPIDFRQEYGTSSLDVRHSVTAAVILQPKWRVNDLAGHIVNGWMLSGIGNFHSGLPYTMRTAGSLAKEFDVNGTAIVALSTGMNGYGGDNRVYGIGRNTYRYPATWKADLRLAKRFDLGQMRQLELMAESFNLFNHQNVTELETVGYTIEPGTVNGELPRLNFLTGIKTGQTEFGKPLDINGTDFYRERQLQFGARMRF